jgi:hypothetical protein
MAAGGEMVPLGTSGNSNQTLIGFILDPEFREYLDWDLELFGQGGRKEGIARRSYRATNWKRS